MASIDRTAYPRFKSSLMALELQALYRPTDEEQSFVTQYTRGDKGQLTLLTLLKCHQNLGYTPALTDVPSQIRTYLSQHLHLPADTMLDVDAEKTLYRYRQLIRSYLRVESYTLGGERAVEPIVEQAAGVQRRPARRGSVAEGGLHLGGGRRPGSHFDSIPKGPLLARVAEKVSDGTLLDLIQRFLDQEILDGMEQWTPQTGVPQGSVLSPLLSNLYLHPLDGVMSQTAYKAIRYCDDLVILCRSQAEAEAAIDLIRGWTAQHGLRLHPEKTRIVDATRGGYGVTFLGYRFASGQRYVRPQGLKGLRDKIRQKTGRTRSGRLEDIIAELNPILRGWFGYFKHARFPVFRKVDSFVRRRLRAILRKREKRPGFGVTHRDHKRWPNAFFAEHGLFTLQEAYVKASPSR